jgi:hypothetical protein
MFKQYFVNEDIDVLLVSTFFEGFFFSRRGLATSHASLSCVPSFFLENEFAWYVRSS